MRLLWFWLVIKGRGQLPVVVFFLFLLTRDNSVCLFTYCLVRRPFCIIPFCFIPIFDRELSFSFVFFRSLIGNFLLFLLFLKGVSNSTVSDSSFLGDPIVPSFEGKDGNSHPGSRFMVIRGLGSKGLQNGRTWRMSGCWFGQQLRDKGNVPHYFHDTHATMMI